MDISENLVNLHMPMMTYIFGLFAISMKHNLGYFVIFKQLFILKFFKFLVEISYCLTISRKLLTRVISEKLTKPRELFRAEIFSLILAVAIKVVLVIAGTWKITENRTLESLTFLLS